MQVLRIVMCLVCTVVGSLIAQERNDVVGRLKRVQQRMESVAAQCSDSLSLGGCDELKIYQESIVPKPGQPVRDIGFEWELKRRQLQTRCEFERVMESLAGLERSVERWEMVCNSARQSAAF